MNNKLDAVRETIVQRAEKARLSLAELSRVAGKNSAYVHQFIYRGTPKTLPEDVRIAIAGALELPEDQLRHAPTPRRASLPPQPQPSSAAPQAAAMDLPVYMDHGRIDPSRAEEWTARPWPLVGTSSGFAVWVTEVSARMRPGELAYVHPSRPAQPGNLVLLVRDGTADGVYEFIGEQDGEYVLESGTAGAVTRVAADTASIMKIVATLFP